MPTSTSTQQIFISYSRRDDAIMQRTVAFLREQGFDVWVDNEQLTPGTPIWEAELEKAIKRADAVVVLSSPDSKKSEWVTRELVVAQRHRKRIFPLLIRGDEDSSLHFRLSTNQYIDLRENEILGLKSLDVAILKYFSFLKRVVEAEKAKKERRKKIALEEEAAVEQARKAKVVEEKQRKEKREQEKADALAGEIAVNKAREEKLDRQKKAAEEKRRVEQRKQEEADELARKTAAKKTIQNKKTASFSLSSLREYFSNMPREGLRVKGVKPKNLPLFIGGGIILLFILGSIIKSAFLPTTPSPLPATETPTMVSTIEISSTNTPTELASGEVAEEITENTPVPTFDIVNIGTEKHPIKILFVPSVNVDFMIAGGDLIESALNEATGLYFEASVPTSYAATIEAMCASPGDTIGFIPAMGYALANQLCGVHPGLAAERYGWNVYWTEFLVARDSEFQTIEDLEGATWAYPDAGSTSGFLYPSAIFADAGITIGETVEAGGHPQAVKAVYNGEADVATAYFSAPLLPEGNWAMGDFPDIPNEVVANCAPDETGRLYCGEYRVLDARAAIVKEAPDVVQKVRILTISGEIPNDTMAFSPDFPADMQGTIIEAVTAYIASDACAETLCNQNFYDWSGVGPIFDENFDGVRLLMEAQGITLENIGE